MTESQRNLLILAVIAVIGAAAGGVFDLGAGALAGVLNTALTLLIVFAIVMLYRRQSGTIAQMATTPRLVLQAAVIVAAAAIVTGTFRLAGLLPDPPFGWAGHYPVVFYATLFACGFAIWWAWQQRVSRW
jgi:hypothetical protein